MAMVNGRPDGLDITADDYIEDVKLDSNIVNFFKGKNVFVTGGSGFLGILIIEKLIRVCKVNKVYVLIRPKKGKDIDKRLEEILNGPVFTKVKQQADFKSRVQAVNGECAALSLGMTPKDLQMIIDNTDIIIHSAATVKFDEKLRLATHINVRGTLELLKIAKKMPNLQSFNYISTAYSNCIHTVVEERIYPPAMSYEKLINLVDSSTDEMLDRIEKDVLGKYPNTYIFTKQVAESIVQSFVHDVPVSIVRPSIIVGTHDDPIAGWINNVYGVTGLVVGGALGLIQAVYSNPDIIIDIVPADFVINTVLAATYEIGIKNKTNPKYLQTPNMEPVIYHMVSGARNPIHFKTLMDYTYKIGVEIPSRKCIWHAGFRVYRNYYVYLICAILFHFIPAAIADTVLVIFQKKPMFWKLYTKIQKFSTVLEYFTWHEFKMPDDNTINLYNSLSVQDKKDFQFDIASFHWLDFYFVYMKGLRVYILNDPLETIPESYAHLLKLKIIHYALVTVISVLLIWFILFPVVSAMASIFGF